MTVKFVSDRERSLLCFFDIHWQVYSMYNVGLIYWRYQTMHYFPSSHSAHAEAELICNDDDISYSVYVAFPLDLQTQTASAALREILTKEPFTSLLIWTTTPQTLTANMVLVIYSRVRRTH